MKLKLVSDLHLEVIFHMKEASRPSNEELMLPLQNSEDADILLIAGDLCKVKVIDNFVWDLKEYFKQYDRVFIVPGNHEAWGSSIESSNEKLKLALNSINTTVLTSGIVNINDDHILFGATFWYSGLSVLDGMKLQSILNDYKHIRDHEYRKTTPEYFERLSLESECALYDAMTENDSKKFIVMTHHPTSRAICRPDDVGYGTTLKLPQHISKDQFALAVHGHTHVRACYTNEWGIETYCNAVGYYGFEERNILPMVLEIP